MATGYKADASGIAGHAQGPWPGPSFAVSCAVVMIPLFSCSFTLQLMFCKACKIFHVCGVFVACSWLVCGVFVACSCCVRAVFLVSLWHARGVFVACLTHSHGVEYAGHSPCTLPLHCVSCPVHGPDVEPQQPVHMTGVPGVAVGAAVGGHTNGHATFMASWAALNLTRPVSNACLAHDIVSDDMAVWMKNLTCYDRLHVSGTNPG